MRRWLLALTFSVAVTSGAPAGAQSYLTLRAANRVIDLAFAAELAGDYDGARKAVRARLSTASRPEEEPGRIRLEKWLQGAARRKRAFGEYGKTAAGYWRAFQTLEGAGYGRADLMWRRALRDIPELEREFEIIAKVAVRFERTVGLGKPADATAWERHLGGLMGKHHLQQPRNPDTARYEVRINLDAKEAAELMNRWRVTAEGDYLLRDRHDEDRLVGSFTKRRAVIRVAEDHARRFAIRRVLDDMGWSLVHQIREDALRDLATP